jgi:hypothetical protein
MPPDWQEVGMDLIALSVFVVSIYLAGELAVRRGRGRTAWLWIAALLLGPFALPMLYLLPRRDAGQPPAGAATAR